MCTSHGSVAMRLRCGGIYGCLKKQATFIFSNRNGLIIPVVRSFCGDTVYISCRIGYCVYRTVRCVTVRCLRRLNVILLLLLMLSMEVHAVCSRSMTTSWLSLHLPRQSSSTTHLLQRTTTSTAHALNSTLM